MNFVKSYANFFNKYVPSPFSIAIFLSFSTLILALIFTGHQYSLVEYAPKLGSSWFNGMFKPDLLSFTVHMMLILVLGHVLALTKTFNFIINKALFFCKDTPTAAFTITLLTILVAMFNWGLGLIFGAIFARKIGEHFQKENRKLNYTLIGAAAYVGLMVWHGGLSGSAPLTVADKHHSLFAEMGVISTSATIFSPMNIFNSLMIIIVLPLVMYFVGKKSTKEVIPMLKSELKFTSKLDRDEPSDRIEKSEILSKIIGIMILLVFVFAVIQKLRNGTRFFNILDLQTTNLLLFGLTITLHKNLKVFLNAVQESIGDISSILIQFPLYFGIMGIIQESGLASLIATTIISAANQFTLPIYTFISASIVNMFVPSGGGQWQVQGPIIVESALKTGTSLPKMIMAFAYGDQLTNMLQPFWALPLLAITGLKAKDILPYTLILFIAGFFIFLITLIIF